jgi:hypothetical protein
MAFYDSTNDHFNVKILNGGEVLLWGTDKYYYFTSADPFDSDLQRDGRTPIAFDDTDNPVPSSIEIGAGQSLGLPSEVYTQFLTNGTIDFSTLATGTLTKLPANADFPTFTFNGGDLHFSDYSHVGLPNKNTATEYAALQALSGTDVPNLSNVWVAGDHNWGLRDHLNELARDLGEFWKGNLTGAELKAGELSSANLAELTTRIAESDVTPKVYYALIETTVDDFESSIFIKSIGATEYNVWVKPILAGSLSSLSTMILNEDGTAIDVDLWDIGALVVDPSTDTPSGLETKFSALYGEMNHTSLHDELLSSTYTFSNDEFWEEFTTVNVNEVLRDLGETFSATDVEYTYPREFELDVKNLDKWSINLDGSSTAFNDSLIENLTTSDNNDYQLTVIGHNTDGFKNASPDFTDLTSAKTIILHNPSTDTTEISIGTFAFNSDQSVTLSGGDYMITRAAGVEFPKEVIVTEGTELKVIYADVAGAPPLPKIINLKTTGEISIDGNVSANEIVGTDGADNIDAHKGDDTITGGKGADTFEFVQYDDGGDGDDIITDFNADEGDKIVLYDKNYSEITTQANSKQDALDNSGKYFIENGVFYYKGGSVVMASSDVTGFESSDAPKFEIYEVDGERYGNIVTFGVKVTDANKDVDFSQIDFGVTWNTDDFKYFADSFSVGNLTKAAGTVGTNIIAEDGNAADGVLTFTATAADASSATLDYSTAFLENSKEDPYIAKFMLERIDQQPGFNGLKMAYSDHTVYDGGTETAFEPSAKDFVFNYKEDIVSVDMTNPDGTVVPGAELFISSATVSDGLSITPTAQIEDLVRYDVVLNVSVPTVLKNDDAAKAPTAATLTITGAEIFDDSVQLLPVSDLGSSVSVDVTLDDASAQTVTAVGKTDEDNPFIDALNTEADKDTPDFGSIGSSEKLILEFSNMTEIQSAGRYKVAEFWARQDASGIQYNYANGTDAASSDITMKATPLGSSGRLVTTVNDGSDVAVLGNTYYENPLSNYRAITGLDALEALRISVADIASTTDDYEDEDYIAADFNLDGEVDATDALAILKTAAYTPELADFPVWYYVQDLRSTTTLGTDSESSSTTVSFDKNIDLFIGKNTTINATAVLVGDTTHSFKALPSSEDYIKEAFGAFLNKGTDVKGSVTSNDNGGDNQNNGGDNQNNAGPTSYTAVTDGTGKIKVDATLDGSTSGSLDYTSGASQLDTALYEIVGVTTNAATGFTDVNSKIGGALKIAADTTPNNAETLVLISDGSVIRGYNFKDNATADATVESSELTHVLTITDMTDVSTLDADDFSLKTVTQPVTPIDETVTSGTTNFDLTGNSTVADTVTLSTSHTANITGFVSGSDTLKVKASDIGTEFSSAGEMSTPSLDPHTFVKFLVDTAATGTGTKPTFYQAQDKKLYLDIKGDTAQSAANQVSGDADDINLAQLDVFIVSGDISIVNDFTA